MFTSVKRKSACVSKCTTALKIFLPLLAGSDVRLPLGNVYIKILLKFIVVTKNAALLHPE